jgi:autotransporter-associated beta strand protein
LNGNGVTAAIALWNAVPIQPVYNYAVPASASPVVTTNKNFLLTNAGNTGSSFDIGAGLALVQSATSNISGSGVLFKTGQGTMVLNGQNSMANLQINAGVVSVSSNAALGDTVSNGLVYFLNAAANPVPATLLVTSSFATNRGIQSRFNEGGNVDVAAGVTFNYSGVANLGTGLFNKIGLGTMLVTGGASAGTAFGLAGGGTFATTTTQPFATTASLALNGGVLSLLQPSVPAANLAVSSGSATFGGGTTIRLQDAALYNTKLTINGNLTRANQGVLTVQAVNNQLGVAATRGEQLLVTGSINGVAVASSNVAGVGILPANILGIDAYGTGSFLSYINSTVGVAAGTATFASATLVGSGTSSVVTLSTGTLLTGSASVYALATSGSITGSGTLNIVSVSNSTQGALLLNGNSSPAAIVYSNLVFGDPNRSQTGGSATSGEAIVYTGGSVTSGTPTLAGNIVANGFGGNGAVNFT